MKHILSITAILVVFLGAQCLYAQPTPERNIFLLHGLVPQGTGLNAWKHYSNHFNNTRKANPIKIQYGQQGSMAASVQEARASMAAAVPASSFGDNIFIGHSASFALARGIPKDFPASQVPYGGFITVGSPNLGAPVINAYQNNEFHAFSGYSTEELFAGPGAPFLQALPNWITGFGNDKIATFIEDQIVATSGISNPITNDFKIGGAYLNQLSNHTSSLPKIGIVSHETVPNSHWKTLTSYVLRPVTDLAFEEVDDDDLETAMRTAQNFYESRETFYRISAAMPHFLPARRLFLNKARQFERGIKWFQNSEIGYNKLIGGAVMNPIYTTLTNHCPCDLVDCENGELGCPYETVTFVSGYVLTEKDTDGIVPKVNQFLPGALDNIELQVGVNHAQQRNHPLITDAFDKILDGEVTQGHFFKVERL
jgi:hypothetical protein